MPNVKLTNYSLTYPKCGITKEHAGELLSALEDVRAVVVAQEHHKDGDTHLHAFVQFKKQGRRGTGIFDLDGHHGNVQGCRNVKNWIQYLVKEDECPWTYNFDIEKCLKKKKATLTIAWALDKSLQEIAEVLPPDRFQRFDAGLQLYRMKTEKPQDLEGPCGIWIHGYAGIGKSFDVRRYCRNKGIRLYDKGHNKWWDGYSGEEAVLLDDVHPDDKSWIAKHLKTWADAYPFVAETKGGSCEIRPKWFIVTSNYEPREFAVNIQDIEPITRRFKLFHAEKFDDTYWFLQETIGWCDIPATPPPSEPELPSPSELDRIF